MSPIFASPSLFCRLTFLVLVAVLSCRLRSTSGLVSEGAARVGVANTYMHHLKLKKVFGKSAFANIFSSESSLKESNLLSFVKLEENWANGVAHPFLGCSAYSSQFSAIKTSFAERNIPLSIIYSSASDHIVCFQALIPPAQASLCETLVDNVDMVFPTPHLLKLEGDLSTKLGRLLGNKIMSTAFGDNYNNSADANNLRTDPFSDVDSSIKLLFESLAAKGITTLELSIALNSASNITESKAQKWVEEFYHPIASSIKIHDHFNRALGLSSSSLKPDHTFSHDSGSSSSSSSSSVFSDIRKSNSKSNSKVDDINEYQKYSNLFRDRAHFPFHARKSNRKSTSLAADEKDNNDVWSIFRDVFTHSSFKSFSPENCVFSDAATRRKNIKYRKSNVIIPIDVSKFLSSSQEDLTCILSLVEYFISMPDVMKVGFSPPLRLQNNAAKVVVQSGTAAGGTPLHTAGIVGTDVIVGLSDTGVDELSCYFIDEKNGAVPRSSIDEPTYDHKYRKVVEYISYSDSGGDYSGGHGSHVAGSIAGDCDSKNTEGATYNGMAPKAKLAIFDIGVNDANHDLMVPADLGYIFGTAHYAGARIHSNSWGGGYWYDSYSIETDDYLYNNDDFAIFFAAGNDGSHGYQSILSPGMAKNAIAVTSSDNAHSNMNIDHISFYSSYGPTNDGRIKPDITAPGNSITSARADSEDSKTKTCATKASSGTSMSTPIMAGNAALVYDYFQNANFWKTFCKAGYPMCKSFKPRGSMLKAVLLNSGTMCDTATNLSPNVKLTTLPDIYQGYGRSSLISTLPLTTHSKTTLNLFIDEVTMTELTETQYTVNVRASSTPLKVTICWYDPVADAFAARTLVNDIDLFVVDSAGNTIWGNSGAVVGKNGVKMPNQRDEVNTNEQVLIAHPAQGTYTVHIQAKRILGPKPSQIVSVVITHDGDISVANNKWHDLKPISTEILRKCATGPSSGPMTSLEISKFSVDNGAGWFSQDSYSLMDGKGAAIVNASTFNKHYMLENDEVCVSVDGSYTLSLDISPHSTMKGTQVGIAQCDILLTPLLPAQTFFLDSDYMSNYSNTYLVDVNDYSCKTSCRSSSHFIMDVDLVEWAGSGWAGAYFAVHSLADGLLDTLSARGVAAGTLEWGWEQFNPVCFPAVATSSSSSSSSRSRKLSMSPQGSTHADNGQKSSLLNSERSLDNTDCYYMELSNPESTGVVFPELRFVNATLLSYYNASTKSFHIPKTKTVCPNYLRYNESFAKICIDRAEVTAEVSFYAQDKTVKDFGQHYVTWQNVADIFESKSTKIATCSLPLAYVSIADDTYSPTLDPTSFEQPSFIPTLAPSQVPVMFPTAGPTVHPTAQPTVEPTSETIDFDVSCLSACSPTPITYKSDLCDLLLGNVFLDCNSYSLSEGTCNVAKCASSCSASLICQYSATIVYDCYTMSGSDPIGSDSVTYKRLVDSCVAGYAVCETNPQSKPGCQTFDGNAQSDPTPATSSQNNFTVIILIVILILISTLGMIFGMPRSLRQCFGFQDDSSSSESQLYRSVGTTSEHGVSAYNSGGIEMTSKDEVTRSPLYQDDKL